MSRATLALSDFVPPPACSGMLERGCSSYANSTGRCRVTRQDVRQGEAVADELVSSNLILSSDDEAVWIKEEWKLQMISDGERCFMKPTRRRQQDESEICVMELSLSSLHWISSKKASLAFPNA